MNTSKVNMGRSAMGNDMLCVDNFLYHYEDRGSNNYRWVCNKRKDKVLPCRSRITTTLRDGDESQHIVEKVIGDHTHDRCTPDEILKVYERKRLAMLAGEPCTTLENKTLKRKLRRVEEYEKIICSGEAKQSRNSEDWLEIPFDDDSAGEGIYVDNENDKCNDDDEIVIDNGCTENRQNDSMEEITDDFQGKDFDPDYLIEELDITNEAPIIAFENEKLYVMKTPQDSELLCMDFFLYRQKGKSLISETFRWECIRRRDLDCSACIYTEQRSDDRHRLKLARPEAHTHGPYTRGRLAKLLIKNNIGVIMEHEQTDSGGIHAFTSLEIADSLSYNTPSPSPSDAPSTPKRTQQQIECKYTLAEDPLAILLNGTENDLDRTKFTFLPSAKGNKVLCLDSYLYHFDSRCPRNGHAYWTCTLRRDKYINCNARVTVEMTETGPAIVKLTGVHTHSDCSNEIKRRLYKYDMAKMASETQLGKNSNSELGKDFRKIVARSKETIERRSVRLRQKLQARQSDFARIDEPSVASASSSSSSSAIESDDDHFEFTPFPRKLKQLRQAAPKTMPTVETIWDVNNADDDVSSEDNDCDDNDEDAKELASFITRRGRPLSNLDAVDEEPDLDIRKVSKLRSAKGGELLCVDGFIYHFKSIQNKRTYWTCIKCKDRTLNCKSRVATFVARNGQLKVFKVTNRHTHPVNEDDIKRRLYNTLQKDVCGRKAALKVKEMLGRPLNELSTQYAEVVKKARQRQRRIARSRNIETIDDDDDMDDDGSSMKLYAVSDGPPSLAVRMTLQALGVPFELINVDFIASQHLSEEYAKMNPQKEIPVLDDDGFYLPESVAIMQYLCDKYADSQTQQLYPKDAKQRAIVNHRLCFNMGFYYASISAHTLAPIFFDYKRTDMSLKKTNNALAVFETYLTRSGTKYAAGNDVTIADFALVSATLCLEAIAFDLSPYPLVKRWYAMFKREQPSLWTIADGGMQELIAFAKNPPDLSQMNHPFHPTRKA